VQQSASNRTSWSSTCNYLNPLVNLTFQTNLTSFFTSREDFQYVFLPILERVGKVLRKQLEECLAKRKTPKVNCLLLQCKRKDTNVTPKKVFVVGGFGQCPSLINYLRQFLQTFSEETCLAEEIMLVDPINHHDRYFVCLISPLGPF
jgi:hypothetical protein